MPPVTHLNFPHGLGDAANFAHALALWVNRGHEIHVHCSPDKRYLFQAAAAHYAESPGTPHHYPHAPDTMPTMVNEYAENKCGWNLCQPPLPNIGSVAALWPELLEVKLSLEDFVTKDMKQDIFDYLLQFRSRPIILIHSRANTSAPNKNMTEDQERALYRALLERTNATLILLDWDNRVARFDHWRVRHLTDDFHGLNLPELWYLIEMSNLLIGVDSGPLHFCRFTSTPAIGYWHQHQPSKFALPRDRTLHLTPNSHGIWNSYRRHSFNIVDLPAVTADAIAEHAELMLSGVGPRSLVQRNLHRKLNHAERSETHQDRGNTLGRALQHLRTKVFPHIVETGCARQRDDWGAGYSTYVFGLFLHNNPGNGLLQSVDLSPVNCRFAREITAPFVHCVEIYEGDSVQFLRDWRDSVVSSTKNADLVYLDSLDTTEPGHEEHGLAEVQQAVKIVKPDGMILIDDTWWKEKRFVGKGAKAVPWLLSQGWHIIEAGYQVLLRKDE